MLFIMNQSQLLKFNKPIDRIYALNIAKKSKRFQLANLFINRNSKNFYTDGKLLIPKDTNPYTDGINSCNLIQYVDDLSNNPDMNEIFLQIKEDAKFGNIVLLEDTVVGKCSTGQLIASILLQDGISFEIF